MKTWKMDIEHRTSIRKKLALDVLINYDLLYSRRWKVHDLSLNGALIQADRTDLPPGVSVEAVLRLKERGKYGLYRLPAEVVRVSGQSAALRFRQYDNRAYTALVDLLYAS